MSVKFAPWTGATRCTGSARPGARALMNYVLANFPKARNLGIYNCRGIAGTSTTSTHGEGRALDVGFPMQSGKGSFYGYALVDALRKAGPANLGVQAIIYDRKIWSAKSPNSRRYTGAHPHYDHVHIELTRGAADSMTLATVRRFLSPAGSTESGIGQSKYETYRKGVKAGSRTVGQYTKQPWSAGDDVKELQRVLNAWYPNLSSLARDGYFGPKTAQRVKTLQLRAGIKLDGFVGKQTWRVIGY